MLTIVGSRGWLLGFVVAFGCGPTLGTGADSASDGMDPADPVASSSSGQEPEDMSTSGVPPMTSVGVTSADSSSGDPDSTSSSGASFIMTTSCAGSDDHWLCSENCSTQTTGQCPFDEKCMPWSSSGGSGWDSTRCSPLDPRAVDVGEPCTVEGTVVSGFDNCVEGAICWGVDEATLTGTCRSFCDTEVEGACDEGFQCAVFNDGTVPVCVEPCEPLGAPSCAEDEVCRLVSSVPGAFCLPLEGGTIDHSGMACGDSACEPSEACVVGTFTPLCEDECCTPLCDLTDPAADETCAAIDPTLSCAVAVDKDSPTGVCVSTPE